MVFCSRLACSASLDGRLTGTQALIAVGRPLSASKTRRRREAIQLSRPGLG